MSSVPAPLPEAWPPAGFLQANPVFAHLLGAISDTLIILDPQWRFTYLNPFALQDAGLPPEELLGHTLWEKYPQLRGTELEAKYRQAMAEQTPAHFETRGPLTGRWLEINAYPFPGGLLIYGRNVTARKRAEDALRESEEHFRQLAEHIREVFYVIDEASGQVLYVSPVYEEVWGRSCASLYQQPHSWIEALHPDDRERVRATLDQRNPGEGLQEEYRVVRPDGALRWLWDRSFPIRDEQGRTVRRVGIAEDVTGRKQIEERLRESEERHRTIAELTSDYAYTCTVDAAGRFTLVSVTEGFGRVTGYTVDDLEAKGGWMALIHPEDLACIQAQSSNLATGERLQAECRILTREGQTRWIRFLAQPVLEAGRLVRLIGAVQDITERKQADAALRESEARFQSFMDNTPAFAWMKDVQGRFVYVNRTHQERFRTTMAARLGQTDFDFRPPEIAQKLREADRAVLRHGRTMEMNEDVPDADGNLRHFRVFKFPFQDASGQSFVGGMAVDVTDRQRAEEQLRVLSRRLLEVQEQERRHLARELHDEIGQALSSLKLALEMAARLPPEQLPAQLGGAQEMVKELLGRVRDLSLRLRPSMLDDLGLLPALVWLLQRYTAQTGVEVVFKHRGLERRFPPEVETTAYRIIQEALTNVARHAGVAEATVRLWDDPGVLALQIEDRGAGFDPASTPAPGTASGLSGMRERAMLLGARLQVESRPGEGTRVSVELPLPDGAGWVDGR